MTKQNVVYQKKAVSIENVINSISIDHKINSRVILCISPCRSGSTALMRIFAAMGIESHFQEIKNTLRWLMQGENYHWTLPLKSNQVLFLKETFGPYTELECSFNPLEVLIRAGLRLDQLHLIVLGRDPLQVWTSWNNLWGNKNNSNVELFIMAYHNAEQIRLQAQQQGVLSTCFIYDTLKPASVEDVFRKLFLRLNLSYSPSSIKNWKKLPPFAAPGSNIIFPEEPPPFDMPSGLELVKQSGEFVYISKDQDIPNLMKSDISKIHENRLYDIYTNWVKASSEWID